MVKKMTKKISWLRIFSIPYSDKFWRKKILDSIFGVEKNKIIFSQTNLLLRQNSRTPSPLVVKWLLLWPFNIPGRGQNCFGRITFILICFNACLLCYLCMCNYLPHINQFLKFSCREKIKWLSHYFFFFKFGRKHIFTSYLFTIF